jgi:hypothetical protein
MPHILMVVTGASYITLRDGSRHPTGYWADEVLIPYRIFEAADVKVDIATPGGVPAPVDRLSLDPQYHGGDPAKAREVADALEAIPGLKKPSRLEAIDEGRARRFTALSFFPAVTVRWKTWPTPRRLGLSFGHLPVMKSWCAPSATALPLC